MSSAGCYLELQNTDKSRDFSFRFQITTSCLISGYFEFTPCWLNSASICNMLQFVANDMNCTHSTFDNSFV